MHLTDTLARAYQSLSPTDTQTSETKRDVESIHTVDYLAILEQQLNEIKQETAKHPNLQDLNPRRGAWKQQLSTKGSLRVLQYQRRTFRTRRNHP